jgi:hypothetical protein
VDEDCFGRVLPFELQVISIMTCALLNNVHVMSEF